MWSRRRPFHYPTRFGMGIPDALDGTIRALDMGRNLYLCRLGVDERLNEMRASPPPHGLQKALQKFKHIGVVPHLRYSRARSLILGDQGERVAHVLLKNLL